jgi:L-alanine-DL-glutamate epimerase-like enolase superfamily enzyme
MKITSLTSQNIRIPLNVPKTFSTKRVAFRDYTIVKIGTADGVEGWAFVWGLPVVNNVIDML